MLLLLTMLLLTALTFTTFSVFHDFFVFLQVQPFQAVKMILWQGNNKIRL